MAEKEWEIIIYVCLRFSELANSAYTHNGDCVKQCNYKQKHYKECHILIFLRIIFHFYRDEPNQARVV